MPTQTTAKQYKKIAYIFTETICFLSHKTTDNVYASWPELLEWEQQDVVHLVRFVIKHPDILPECLHEKWLEKKEKERWIYDSVTSSVTKTHRHMLSYNKLPEHTKNWYTLFRVIVNFIYVSGEWIEGMEDNASSKSNDITKQLLDVGEELLLQQEQASELLYKLKILVGEIKKCS